MKGMLLGMILVFQMGITSNPLEKYKWKNRIILITTPAENQLFKDQINEFTDHEEGLLDRDLIIVSLIEKEGKLGKEPLDQESVRLIREQFHLSSSQFTIALIGKDGTLKFKSEELTSPEKIFELIDRMPMRRAEMRRKDK